MFLLVRPKILVTVALMGAAAGGQPPSSSQPHTPAGRRVEYAPGVVIDWPNSRVELEGKVVLREGLLELFACSRGTREHESIVAVRARPLRIREALGLIGLEPGHPTTYDRETDRWMPCSGDPVQIEVRYRDAAGKTKTVDAWQWMKDAKTDKAAAARDWVFCGSRIFASEVFGADADGTVACVVDFDTALIGLAESHSADNALLWVAANTDEIPPLGTACTLLIRPVESADQAATSATTQPTVSPPVPDRNG